MRRIAALGLANHRTPFATRFQLTTAMLQRGREDNSRPSTARPDTLIVDDCRLYRERLTAIMARYYCSGRGPIRTSHDTTAILRALDDRCPDVTLKMLASFDSRAVTQAGRAHTPQSRLTFIGVSEDDEGEIADCTEAGMSGYCLQTGWLTNLCTNSRENLLPPRHFRHDGCRT